MLEAFFVKQSSCFPLHFIEKLRIFMGLRFLFFYNISIDFC